MARLGPGIRRIIAIALIAGGCLLVLVGDLAIYAERNVLDADRFADRAVHALDDEPTREEVGRIVAEQLEERVDPDLVAYRAVIEAAVAALADTGAFRTALRTGIAEAHRLAFGEGRDTATVTVANVGVLAAEGLRALSPEAARRIPKGFEAELISLSEAGAATDAIQVELGPLPWLAPLLGLALLALGVAAATERRRATTAAALGVAAVGALVVIAYLVGEALVAGATGDEGAEAAVRSLWAAMLGDLRDWNLMLAVTAAIVAGASASLLRPAGAAERLGALGRRLTTPPHSAWAKAARGLALLVAGILALAAPEVALRVVVLAAAIALAYVGASELLALIAGPAPARRREHRLRAPRRAASALIAAAGVAVVVVLAAGADDTGAADDADACNGSAELCDRTLDEVVFPATHNSMSAADYPGFLFPMHERAIPRQLADGVRALLIDAYYGYPGRRVYTDFERGPNKLREQMLAELGPQFVAAADRVRDTLTEPSGESTLYLCHGFCELGAIDLVDTLRDIDSFVAEHPHEVILIDIEDYVDPEDIVAAFEESGLAEHVYDGPLGPDFPTLRELIEREQQVIVLAENRAGAAPWYRLTYDYFQETGYDFSSPAEMNCAPNRGSPANPLFLINHWINTDPQAKPSNARLVNARDFLLRRARRCERRRERLPNVIAVDFYEQGDLLGVAAELNRVR